MGKKSDLAAMAINAPDAPIGEPTSQITFVAATIKLGVDVVKGN